MNAPTLSVMMSNYNHARFIPDALDAILSQSYRPLEIVIIDDASTDNSVEVLERYQQRAPDLIRLIRNEKNLGGLANAERHVAMAAGDYIYFAAFDDRILPGFLERSMRALTQYPAAGQCSALSRIMDESGALRGLVRMPVVLANDGYIAPEQVLSTLRRHGNWFMGNTVVFRRSALIDAGTFREELGSYADNFVSLVIALKHGACFLPEPLAVWRRMDGTYSHRIVSDIERTRAILATAEHLMRTTYRDLFPATYVEQWRREMYFGFASSHATASAPEGFANARRLVPATTHADRFFDRLMLGWPRLGRRLAKPYFFAKLKRHDTWRTIRRWFTHWILATAQGRASRGAVIEQIDSSERIL